MIDPESAPEIGQIVLVKRGREAGNLAVIIGIIDQRFVLLADGERRKFDNAKKKNVSHTVLFSCVSDEVKRSIEETGRVTNAKIRHALLSFSREQPELLMEGE
ncbi:KOW domain-containing RNA-binding protein [Bacillus piscicola]|uniref:KOW domain-containing RNA-binding protein n=1 Tax=Bacillus piscicola TaxID=1632684 RepID=UPI001F09BD49|nr:KOW domain-containing RNA-binding protein [Bacillus piscicola]